MNLMAGEKSYKVLFLGRVLLGLIFAYSGFVKLTEPIENFRGAMAAYEIIPYVLIPFLAHSIPWVEFVFGVFLIVGYLPRVSASVLALMSLSFILLILLTRILTGRLPENCGCFGEGALIHLKPFQVILLDIFSVVVGAKLARIKDHPFSLAIFLKKIGQHLI